jgi:hypothetical protein
MQAMIGKMARMFPMFLLMGFMIVVIAFFIGLNNSNNAATYFAETKAVRETELTSLRAGIEATGIWLPTFKFLGLGFILGGIVMALRIIIDNLKAAGMEVMANLPEDKRPSLPNPPWYGPLMPVTMMVAMMIFIAAFVVGLLVAGQASDLFSNPIPTIDAAAAGSPLLTQLQAIQTAKAWLVPFKFLGIALMFTSIVQGLSTIVFILTQQTQLIEKGIELAREARAQMKQAA